MDTITETLKNHPFLKEIPTQYLDLFATNAATQTFKVGEYVFEESDEANEFYLIINGEVALEIFTKESGPTTIQFIRDGEILGWSWLVAPHHWRFDARVAKPTTALVLDGKFLRQQCEQDHSFGYVLLKQLSRVIGQRLEVTRIRLLQPNRLEQI